MALVTINNLSIGYRGPPLLNEVSCQIEVGQRIGLLGRNGSGKTTFMRILCGDAQPDTGAVLVEPGTKVSLLPQEVPLDLDGTIFEVVNRGVSTDAEYNANSPDAESGWESHLRVERILSKMELDGTASFERLSSGMKRRVLLARALVMEPELLLLDEPTNHLDIDAIAWLEGFLSRWKTTLIFVTHDRMFLRRLANRILEIDRGQLFDWSCDYDAFLRRKEDLLAAQEKQDALFDKKLAQEEIWIRQGIKARRTRNEGRVRALERMRQERRQRRSATGNVRLRIQEGLRSGNLVAEVKEISFTYGKHPIVRDFSCMIMRGDKIGVIGPNGVGKTTLLKIVLGKLAPQHGSVRLGTNLQVAYFDQLRQQLDENLTIEDNVGEGYDSVGADGHKRHVIGYLQDFLFTPERARTPVRFLSGGERNRVLLAKLFAKPANVIVLDEPTNDLDTETLELLESRLVEFAGTVLLVSHDRAFLNNVVTSTIVFELNTVKEYVGGYDDWRRQRPDEASKGRGPVASSSLRNSIKAKPGNDTGDSKIGETSGKRKLKYKEQQELESLPITIEQLESAISELHETMARADFYKQSGELISKAQSDLADLESQLAIAFSRWEELDQIAG